MHTRMKRSLIALAALALTTIFASTGCANAFDIHTDDAPPTCEGSCVAAQVTHADGARASVGLHASATKLPWKPANHVTVLGLPDSTTDELSLSIDLTCDQLEQPIPLARGERALTITKVNAGQQAPRFLAASGTLTLDRCGTNVGDVIEGHFERAMPADPNADNLGIVLVRGYFRAVVR